ncbi:MAG: phenylalanine--tRNA ligase subunit beta [Patescibacteria group bacterium]
MDIKLPDSTLRKYLLTKASAEKIAEALTLCGPSIERLHKVTGNYVYDIEAITNRVDSASAFGIAREAATILPFFGVKAKLINDPYDIKAGELPERKSPKLPLTVEIRDQALVKRFAAIVLDGIVVKDSPKEIREELELAGERALNNLVDITNYLRLCFGQPVHIFDYDKISGAKMILRESKPGEKITTLDDRTHSLRGGDIVIEDGDGRLIDLCGIMGGKLSQVDDQTGRAVLFVQTYEPKRIRRTSLYTQKRTLAAQIFEKQPDSRLVIPTLIEGVKLLVKYANAKIAGDSIDLYYLKPEKKTIKLDLKLVNDLIGFKFDAKTVASILTGLGFTVKKFSPATFGVDVPSWRTHDVTIWPDLAEEIARIYGYFRLEGKLPVSAHLTTTTDPLLEIEYQAKSFLANLGFTEIFNYSLVGADIFTKADMDIDHSLALTNPLTSEFEYLRRSLIPSLLMDLANNQGKVDLPIRIFELSNIYLPALHPPGERGSHLAGETPAEQPILAMASQGLDYRTGKGYLEALLAKFRLNNLTFKPFAQKGGPWQINQTAEVYSGKHFLGVFGRLKPAVKSAFNLKGDVYLANLDFRAFASLANTTYTYTPISEYPDMIEDITIESNRTIGELIQLIKVESKLITKVIYQDSLKNKHTFTIHFNNPKRNLTQEEVNQIKTKLLKLA